MENWTSFVSAVFLLSSTLRCVSLIHYVSCCSWHKPTKWLVFDDSTPARLQQLPAGPRATAALIKRGSSIIFRWDAPPSASQMSLVCTDLQEVPRTLGVPHSAADERRFWIKALLWTPSGMNIWTQKQSC